MTTLYQNWQQYRDAKNECNREFGVRFYEKSLSFPLTEQEQKEEENLLRLYSSLYAKMEALEAQFDEEDWAAFDAEQESIREMEHQAWLIENRYGTPKPKGGIADWWSA